MAKRAEAAAAANPAIHTATGNKGETRRNSIASYRNPALGFLPHLFYGMLKCQIPQIIHPF